MNIKRVEFAEDQRPIDPACGCMVCQRYTRAYLRHLFMVREPLGATLNSIHNLAFYLDIMERVGDNWRGRQKHESMAAMVKRLKISGAAALAVFACLYIGLIVFYLCGS